MFGRVFGAIHQIIWVADLSVSLLGWLVFNLVAMACGGVTGLLLLNLFPGLSHFFAGWVILGLAWCALGLVGFILTTGFGWILLFLTSLHRSRRFLFWMDQVEGSTLWDMESVVTVDQVFFFPVVVVASQVLDPALGYLVVVAWALLTMLGWAWFFRRHW